MTDSVPGHSALLETEEYGGLYSGPDSNHSKILAKVKIDDGAVDAGNSPTTTLRGGLLMGKLDADGKCVAYDADANDGSQKVVGIMPYYLSMLNRTTYAVEDKMSKLLTGGIFKDITQVVGYTLHAAAVLLRSGFRNAVAEPHGSAFLLQPKAVYFKNGTTLTNAYTVVAGDHGCMLVATTAAMTFTMPTLADVGPGFSVLIYNGVDANLVVSAAANTILTGDAGGAKSTTLTFSTANAKMGAHVLMYSYYDDAAGALSWLPLMVNRTVATA